MTPADYSVLRTSTILPNRGIRTPSACGGHLMPGTRIPVVHAHHFMLILGHASKPFPAGRQAGREVRLFAPESYISMWSGLPAQA